MAATMFEAGTGSSAVDGGWQAESGRMVERGESGCIVASTIVGAWVLGWGVSETGINGIGGKGNLWVWDKEITNPGQDTQQGEVGEGLWG